MMKIIFALMVFVSIFGCISQQATQYHTYSKNETCIMPETLRQNEWVYTYNGKPALEGRLVWRSNYSYIATVIKEDFSDDEFCIPLSDLTYNDTYINEQRNISVVEPYGCNSSQNEVKP